jgi:hypothetical protein
MKITKNQSELLKDLEGRFGQLNELEHRHTMFDVTGIIWSVRLEKAEIEVGDAIYNAELEVAKTEVELKFERLMKDLAPLGCSLKIENPRECTLVLLIARPAIECTFYRTKTNGVIPSYIFRGNNKIYDSLEDLLESDAFTLAITNIARELYKPY